MLFWKVKIMAWNYKYYICPYESTCDLHYVHKSRVEICRVYVNIGLFTLPLIKIMNYVVVLYKQCTRINYQREVIMNSICEMYGIFISLYRLNVKHGNGIRISFNLHILSVKNYKRLFKMRLANKCTCVHVYNAHYCTRVSYQLTIIVF